MGRAESATTRLLEGEGEVHEAKASGSLERLGGSECKGLSAWIYSYASSFLMSSRP